MSTKKFRLPTTITNLLQKSEHRCVAHNLDFDLVAVANNEQEAKERLSLCIKTYVEFGLSKGWDDNIYFPAPEEIRAELKRQDIRLEIAPPIEIASDFKPVIVARRHESERIAS